MAIYLQLPSAIQYLALLELVRQRRVRMMRIKARSLGPPALESKPLSSVCDAFVDGYCPDPECPSSHEICFVGDGFSTTVPVVRGSLTNYLSLAPRVRACGEPVFDDDGPGSFSLLGPRHDNDHVEVQHIQILPTTDEVSRRVALHPKACLLRKRVDTLLAEPLHAVQRYGQPAVSSTWNNSFNR